MELWKKFEIFDKYEVSNLGRVRNIESRLILRQKISITGYCSVVLYDKELKRNYLSTHRCVAKVWVDGYKEGLQVNHINGIKIDNRSKNLEWVTASENILHAVKTGLFKNMYQVSIYDMDEEKEIDFISISDLALYLDIEPNTIFPYILSSKKYPFLGRYKITFHDEHKLTLAEYRAVGQPVYVYDYLTKTSIRYDTLQQASYYTGIRSLSKYKNNPTSSFLKNIGYSLNFNSDVFTIEDIDDETVDRNRLEYRAIPYRSRSAFYLVYNYYSKEEYRYENLDKLINFLSINGSVEKSVVSDSIHYNAKWGRSGLVKGYGVRSSLYENINTWTEYTEEKILSSKSNLGTTHAFYKIHHNGKVVIIPGRKLLIKYFENLDDRPYSYHSLMKHLKLSNLPNLRVERLDKPIP